jgi:hypothetical protein
VVIYIFIPFFTFLYPDIVKKNAALHNLRKGIVILLFLRTICEGAKALFYGIAQLCIGAKERRYGIAQFAKGHFHSFIASHNLRNGILPFFGILVSQAIKKIILFRGF